MSALKNFYETLLAAGTYLVNSVASFNILGQARNHAVYVVWGTGTTAGQVVVEEAPYKEYTGTWVNLATFDWTAAGKVDVWSSTRAIGAVRTRVVTAIAGSEGDAVAGGVKTLYVGN